VFQVAPGLLQRRDVMASLRPVLVGLLMLAAPALASGSLDERRAEVSAQGEALSQLQREQQARRDELGTLSERIEGLKASRRGRLLPGGELDAALKRSQELAATLTRLAQQVTARAAELEATRLALVDGLTAELGRLRADFDRQPAREVRTALIARLRALRTEREAVRAALPPARLPTLEALPPSDDPEELLEQAERLRDDQQRAQKELASLEVRLTERRQEVELDRRVQRFLGEESMFDDQDHRLRVQRSSENNYAPAVQVAGSPQDRGLGSNSAAGPASGSGGALPGSQAVQATDARPQPGGVGATLDDEDGLAALERQRAALRRLADDLAHQADQLERRAGALK
jgi:hypothetical protein